LKNETVAVIGYGVQGPAQSLTCGTTASTSSSARHPGSSATGPRINDGWVPGKTLFEIEEAAERGTIIQMLVSDAAQKAIWPEIKKHLKKGDAVYFSHGFSSSTRTRPA